jgi:HEAT repeat protein
VFNIILDLARDENPAISSCALGNISMIAGESLPKYPRFPELFALALDAVQGVDRARQSSALTVLRFVGSSHAEALQQQLTPERRARLLTRLKAGMEDRERGYRIRCLEMLGYLRERSVVPRLVELLNHEDATVRSFAILALGHVGDPAALPALEKVAATDPATNHRRELYLRQSAQQAVHQIRPATEPAEP